MCTYHFGGVIAHDQLVVHEPFVRDVAGIRVCHANETRLVPFDGNIAIGYCRRFDIGFKAVSAAVVFLFGVVVVVVVIIAVIVVGVVLAELLGRCWRSSND